MREKPRRPWHERGVSGSRAGIARCSRGRSSSQERSVARRSHRGDSGGTHQAAIVYFFKETTAYALLMPFAPDPLSPPKCARPNRGQSGPIFPILTVAATCLQNPSQTYSRRTVSPLSPLARDRPAPDRDRRVPQRPSIGAGSPGPLPRRSNAILSKYNLVVRSKPVQGVRAGWLRGPAHPSGLLQLGVPARLAAKNRRGVPPGAANRPPNREDRLRVRSRPTSVIVAMGSQRGPAGLTKKRGLTAFGGTANFRPPSGDRARRVAVSQGSGRP